MKLKDKTWYWIADPREGDLWYPIYVQTKGSYLIDCKKRPTSELSGLTLKEAVIPTIT